MVNGLNPGVSVVCPVIVRKRVVFKQTIVVGVQSQVKSQMMVFVPLVVVLIGHFCLEMISSQDLRIAKCLVACSFIVSFDPSIFCLNFSVSFEVT